MTEDDFSSVNQLVSVLLKDFVLRICIEIALGVLYAWSGEPEIALVWIILVLPAECLEIVLHRSMVRADQLTRWHLYGQFAVSLIGGGVWCATGVYLWMTGNVVHMVAGLAAIVGVYMHVTFKYVDWRKGLVIAALPPSLALMSLGWLTAGLKLDTGQMVLLVFSFGGLMYYMYIVSSASVNKQTQLKRALNAAATASQSKSIFLANMSHEIRTPLNGVLGMADLLHRSDLKPAQKEMVGIIRSSGDTLNRVIDDILDISKIEAGHLTLESEVFELGDLVQTVAATSELRAREKGLSFSCHFDRGKDLHFFGDALRLKQVISNLVSNAIKFTSVGSVILEMEAVPSEDKLTCDLSFTVTDTGPGLSEEEQSRIFQPFVQVDGSMSRKHGGSGLGLSIVHQISELMSGKLSVESRKGEGATFRFVCRMPLADEETVRAHNSEPEVSSLIVPVRGGNPTILVAEDHHFNRRVLELMLSDFDVDLVFAEDGIAAVQAYRDARFDLVLMDIQMPGIDGVEALELIRRFETEAGLKRVPVVALTANAMKHQVDDYKRAGFDTHLAKPINIEELVSVVNTCLRPNTASLG